MDDEPQPVDADAADARGPAATAASARAILRDVEALKAVNFEALRDSIARFDLASDSIAAISRQNSAMVADALKAINESNLHATRQAFSRIDLGSGWNSKLDETIKSLKFPTTLNAQVAEAMREIAKLPRIDFSPRFEVVVAEAVILSEAPEVKDVIDERALADITGEQLQKLRGELLAAISLVGQLVAILSASARIEAASTMLGLLAILVSAYDKLGE